MLCINATIKYIYWSPIESRRGKTSETGRAGMITHTISSVPTMLRHTERLKQKKEKEKKEGEMNEARGVVSQKQKERWKDKIMKNSSKCDQRDTSQAAT